MDLIMILCDKFAAGLLFIAILMGGVDKVRSLKQRILHTECRDKITFSKFSKDM